MIEKLPQWYKVASLSALNTEIIDKRSASIKEILSEKDRDWFLECVRYYLGKAQKNKDFKDQFFALFKKHDSVLLEDEFELEGRVLAGAIVAESIIADSESSIYCALALISGNFGMELSSIINIDVLQSALDYLKKESLQVRKLRAPVTTPVKYPALKEDGATLEAVTAYAKSLTQAIKVFEKNADNQKSSFEHNLSVLKEESEIHWWIFREYCNTLEMPIKDLSGAEAPLAVAKDLYELISMYLPPVNFKEFLRIEIAKIPDGLEKEFTVSEYVHALCQKDELRIEDAENDAYYNLCPLHFACSQAAQFETAAWVSIFEQKTGLKSDTNFKSIDIAEQFLIEQTLFNL
ncbi:MAG TPA: GTPase-associated system all-helical protein GASH [Flavobacterium sp.]|uniref:GTPase-associated system all-helical protein GASH n=1 Tax=Flavobacterium TaxID=237 RepID=UPI002ED157B9